MATEKNTNKMAESMGYIRMLVSGYLVYLGGDLIYDMIRGEATHLVLSIVAAAAFIVVGGAVLVRECRAWRRSQHASDEQEALPEEAELPEESE